MAAILTSQLAFWLQAAAVGWMGGTPPRRLGRPSITWTNGQVTPELNPFGQATRYWPLW